MPVTPHAFGPSPDNAWTRHDDCLSLVRSTRAPQPLRLPIEGDTLEVDLARSALIVVDMQNDFCHPLGWFGQKGMDVTPMRAPIPAIASLLPAWRAVGGRVIRLNWGVRPDRLNLSPTILYKGKRSAEAVGYAEHSPDDHGPSVVPGSWGAQVVDELPLTSSDVVVYKHRLSGFWDNELDSLLRQQGITTLFYAGVNTDRCVFSTLQDAGFLGYDNILLSDACGTPSPDYVSQAIHFLVRQLHGFVATTPALLEALSSPRTRSLGSLPTPPKTKAQP